MKNTVIKITATTIGIFFSFTAVAQQAVKAKTPEPPSQVIQTTTENKTPVAPASGIKIHETAVKKSSFNGPVPVKADDNKPEAIKAPEQKPLPETNKIFPPNPVKNK